mgnify:CR=1 FL=1
MGVDHVRNHQSDGSGQKQRSCKSMSLSVDVALRKSQSHVKNYERYIRDMIGALKGF